MPKVNLNVEYKGLMPLHEFTNGVLTGDFSAETDEENKAVLQGVTCMIQNRMLRTPLDFTPQTIISVAIMCDWKDKQANAFISGIATIMGKYDVLGTNTKTEESAPEGEK